MVASEASDLRKQVLRNESQRSRQWPDLLVAPAMGQACSMVWEVSVSKSYLPGSKGLGSNGRKQIIYT